MDALDVMLRFSDLVAILGREVDVRLLNISSAGCLLESSYRLEPGATGLLRLIVDEAQYEDDVRVIRCKISAGSSAFQLGVEFLWTTTPHERSLRRVLAKVRGAKLRAASLDLRIQ